MTADTNRPTATTRWAIGLLAAMAVGSGCNQRPTPAAPAAPPFRLPAVGDATDTVLRIGDPFPTLQAVDLDGKEVTVDRELLGDRYTLIVFWSTWCGFCMQELPHEVELAKQYEAAGLRVIGVNGDETAAMGKAAAEEHGADWLHLYEGRDTTLSKKLGINEWPALLLVGPDGKFVCATQHLRGISVVTLPDGSFKQVNGLDWTLEELLNKEGQARGGAGAMGK